MSQQTKYPYESDREDNPEESVPMSAGQLEVEISEAAANSTWNKQNSGLWLTAIHKACLSSVSTRRLLALVRVTAVAVTTVTAPNPTILADSLRKRDLKTGAMTWEWQH